MVARLLPNRAPPTAWQWGPMNFGSRYRHNPRLARRSALPARAAMLAMVACPARGFDVGDRAIRWSFATRDGRPCNRRAQTPVRKSYSWAEHNHPAAAQLIA